MEDLVVPFFTPNEFDIVDITDNSRDPIRLRAHKADITFDVNDMLFRDN